jgi:hypothetical protein
MKLEERAELRLFLFRATFPIVDLLVSSYREDILGSNELGDYVVQFFLLRRRDGYREGYLEMC